METALFKTTKCLSSSASQSRGEQSEIVGVSSMKSLSQISHREAKKWEAIRRLSLSLYLPLALSITLSAPARPHARQHDSSQHDWNARRFLSAELNHGDWWALFCSPFLACRLVALQADDCLQIVDFHPRFSQNTTARDACACGMCLLHVCVASLALCWYFKGKFGVWLKKKKKIKLI